MRHQHAHARDGLQEIEVAVAGEERAHGDEERRRLRCPRRKPRHVHAGMHHADPVRRDRFAAHAAVALFARMAHHRVRRPDRERLCQRRACAARADDPRPDGARRRNREQVRPMPVRMDDARAFAGRHRRDPRHVGRPRRPGNLLDRDPVSARRHPDPSVGRPERIDQPEDPDRFVHTVSCGCRVAHAWQHVAKPQSAYRNQLVE